jgi:hypothetical protein
VRVTVLDLPGQVAMQPRAERLESIAFDLRDLELVLTVMRLARPPGALGRARPASPRNGSAPPR